LKYIPAYLVDMESLLRVPKSVDYGVVKNGKDGISNMLMKVVTSISFLLVLVGAGGVMNDAGQIQPVCCAMVLIGAVGMFIVGKEFYLDGVD